LVIFLSADQAADGARKGFNPPVAFLNIAFFPPEFAHARHF
jgi:hypothetical protein